jgi:hypothetical protein
MAGRGRPGSAPQTAKREQYAALIARGVNSSEACRIVGINRRTGKRWRHGRTITSSSGQRLHYAPVVGVKRTREISARFLSEDEEICIADLHRAGEGVRAIARELGRSPATVRVGSYAATSMQTAARTARTRRSSWPSSDGHGRRPESSSRTWNCASSCRTSSSDGGVPSRSRRLREPSSRVSCIATSYTRRSTRRSTVATSVACAGTCPGCCAPVGCAASRTAEPRSVAASCPT